MKRISIGGIYSYGGTVTMNFGSTIAANTANRYNGGIITTHFATVNMNGGSITANTPNDGP